MNENPAAEISGKDAVPALPETFNHPSSIALPAKEDQPFVAPKSDLGGSASNPVPESNQSINHQLSTINDIARLPSETPRAYSAFISWLQLGQGRSLPALADKLDESLDTIKRWSSKYDWSARLNNFNSQLLAEHTDCRRRQSADWAARLNRFREQEWDASQKLLAAAQCFLEAFGEQDLQKINLSQASRALKISSSIGRSALLGAELPPSPEAAVSPLQQQLLDAVTRVYGQAAHEGNKLSTLSSELSTSPPTVPSSLNTQPSENSQPFPTINTQQSTIN